MSDTPTPPEYSSSKVSCLEWSGPLEDVEQYALAIRKSLGDKPFVLWLDGPMGAGKTTFTRFLLQAFGLSARIPVTSPTYTYMNDYVIDAKNFAHVDLYRTDDETDASEWDLFDYQEFYGIIIEWPQKSKGAGAMSPTHHLTIRMPQHGLEARTYSFKKSLP